jgi:5-methylcytosine-specific restriction endonuclease McrA
MLHGHQGALMTIIENSDHIAGKICRTCGDWKPLAEYSRRMEHGAPTGDGYQNACKPCRSSAEMTRYRAKGEVAKARLREQYIIHRKKRLAEMRAYRSANRDKVLEQKRTHWAANRERINFRRRLQYAANPELHKATDRAYYIANPEKRINYGRAYRKANPDKIRSLNRSYYERFPQKFIESENRRRARKAQAEGSHTLAEWEALKARYHYSCLCCGRQEPTITLARDHIKPLDAGGSDDISNLQPLCKSCNSRKSTKYIDYRPSSEEGE